MDIKLKNVKYIASMSEETHCFTATLYIDGNKACEVSNRGYGGPNEFSDDSVRAKIDAYGKTLPVVVTEFKDANGKNMELEVDSEIIIGDLMNTYLLEKDLKNLLSKRVVFTVKNKKGLFQTSSLKKDALAKVLQNPEAIKKQFKDTDQILNLLPFETAMSIYKIQTSL